MVKVNSQQAKEEFKKWVKDFLSCHVDVKLDDVWTLDLIAETISMKYDKELSFILENI